MANLKNLLDDFVKVDGINSVVVIGRDGFVIESAGNSVSNDVEAVGAVISTGVGSSEVMGSELSVGQMSQSMVEYEQGMIMANLLGRDAILAVVASIQANLGNVRYQLKKRAPEIERAL